ncbi:MAG: ABC transporter permease subunit [Planctomycetes bacterium]|nr:ABC transporter permease subunit [Planctomycetota bacterium]
MKVPGAAILGRELGSVARRWTSYAVRALFVFFLAAIIVLVWSVRSPEDGMGYSQRSELGHGLFLGLFGTEMFLVTLVGPLLTGGLIADERERRTLELLLLTPMHGLEIVFGKFLSRMAYLLGVLLLATPVLLGCMTFGGVAPDEILLGNALVFGAGVWSGAIGFTLSGRVRRGYLAVIGSYAILLLQTLGLFLFCAYLLRGTGRPPALLFLTSPQMYGAARILSGGEVSFWGMDIWPQVLVVTLLLSLLLVAGSVGFLRSVPGMAVSAGMETQVRRRVRRTRADSSVWVRFALGVLGGGWAVFVSATCMETVEESRGLALLTLPGMAYALIRLVRGSAVSPWAERRVWDNPVAWREVAHGRSTPMARIVNLCLLALSVLLYVFFWGQPSTAHELEFHAAFLSLELCVVLVLSIVLGAASIAQEAEAGHLDLLLATPIPPAKILAGKTLAVWTGAAPLLSFLAMHAFGLLVLPQGSLLSALLVMALAGVLIYFHSTVALALSLWIRRVGVVIGLCLTAGLLGYLFLPILLELTSSNGPNPIAQVRQFFNPVTAMTWAVTGHGDGLSRTWDWFPAMLGWPLSLGTYLGAGLALRYLLVCKFDWFSRRCR